MKRLEEILKEFREDERVLLNSKTKEYERIYTIDQAKNQILALIPKKRGEVDPNEICEVDLEKLSKEILKYDAKGIYQQVAIVMIRNIIAEAGVIKFREEK